jgi:hypothetical protein
MRKTRLVVCFAVLCLLAVPALGQTNANPGWEKLKTLAGEWQGKTSQGAAVRARYQLHSGDSALIETLEPEKESSMVTVYHLDGARLMMTHYCGAKNQPRMRARVSGDGKQITFSFFDATNLASPSTGHMKKVVVTFVDPSHFRQEWTFTEAGKDMTETFEFTRVK